MRIYINQKERDFLTNVFCEYIEDFLSDEQFNENFECDESDEIEVINSLLKKLNNRKKRSRIKIRYTYEKL
jgi:hypothetical protein